MHQLLYKIKTLPNDSLIRKKPHLISQSLRFAEIKQKSLAIEFGT